MASADPPALITTADGLAELIDHLRSAGSFAYDSEFIGEMSYVPKLCLIQVGTPQRVALVDPFAELDLSPLWQLMIDPAVEKVVHAGQQDLEPVYRATSRPAANVFDTQIAAGFVGLTYPAALSKLVAEFTGANLGKGYTFTHWDNRPLSAVQLRYAADDVRYLPAVRQAIGQLLAQRGHAAWAAEECGFLSDPDFYKVDLASQYLHVRGAHSLGAKSAAVLRDLVIWRDQQAREADLPARAYMKDDMLLEIARTPPRDLDGFSRIRGLSRPLVKEIGPAIIELARKAIATPAEIPVALKLEETATGRFQTDSIWAAAQAICFGQGVDPSLAASRNDVAQFLRALHEKAEADHKLMRGWRRELLGEPLSRLLRGELKMELGATDGELRSAVSQV